MNNDSRSFEDELASLKADVAVIRSNYVTKTDLQEVRIELKGEIHSVQLGLEKLRSEVENALHAQTWKLVGSAAALVAAVYFIARAGY
jgi:hypothetical protein